MGSPETRQNEKASTAQHLVCCQCPITDTLLTELWFSCHCLAARSFVLMTFWHHMKAIALLIGRVVKLKANWYSTDNIQ